ncbi:hypothetical protein [Hirschia litorea]|uniref:Lipoprotein n=1 Tax=Hirschia litorea TaxID=1199156 RepID=A0ABW2ILU7_9PROT
MTNFVGKAVLLSAMMVTGLITSGCASTSTSTLLPTDIPYLYGPTAMDMPVSASANSQRCDAIFEEINTLNTGLGSTTSEEAPAPEATASDRVLNYAKDFALETVKGPFQPLLQTKRAIFNDEEKARLLDEGETRGQIRRAYLMGLARGIPCANKPMESLIQASSEPEPDTPALGIASLTPVLAP